MNPLIYVVFAGVGMATVVLSHKMASPYISQNLGAVMISVFAVMAGAILWLSRGASASDLHFTPKGMAIICVAGIAAFAIDYFMLKAFNNGASASLANPIFVGVATMLPVLFGLVFLGETLSLIKIIGITAILFGSVLLGIVS